MFHRAGDLYFEVDIEELELDTMLHLSDIKLPDGVEIPELEPGSDNDQAIVSIRIIKVQEEPEEEEAVEGEEGEALAEGEAPAEDDSGEVEAGKKEE